MDNAIVNKWYQSLEDKSMHSVFAAFRVKFNVELSCSEKIIQQNSKNSQENIQTEKK